MENTEPVHISYNVFEELRSGMFPTSKWQIVGHIKDGKEYFVDLVNGTSLKIIIDVEENLVLQHEK